MLDNLNLNLYLIRHGESAINVQPNIIGQSPFVPLTHRGINQAKALGARFRMNGEYFDYLYSSHYTRAFDTAYISKGDSSQPIIIYEDLREYDAGDWLGSNRNEVMTNDVLLRMNNLNMQFLPPNGESLNQVERRVSEWLDSAILYNQELLELGTWKQNNNHPDLNIATFTHGMVIKCLLHYLFGFDKSSIWKINIDNTGVTKLSFGKQGWRLHYLNDTSHLFIR